MVSQYYSLELEGDDMDDARIEHPKSVICVSCGESVPQTQVDERTPEQIMVDFLAFRGLTLDERAAAIQEQGLIILSDEWDNEEGIVRD